MKRRLISQHMRLVLATALLLTGLAWSVTETSQQSHPMDAIPIADAHLHLLNFLQNSGYLLDGVEIPPAAAHTLPITMSLLRLALLLA